MGVIIRDKKLYWPGGCIPYAIDDGTVSTAVRAQIMQTIDTWNNSNTGVRLIPRKMQTNYVMFRSIGGNLLACSSPVGMGGGEQILNLPEVEPTSPPPPVPVNCRIIHEIGHALGIKHEHQRSDRDFFITVDFTNVESAAASNFTKLSTSSTIDIGPYDYSSVMHYSQGAFAVDPTKPVWTLVPPNSPTLIASSFLQPGDIAAAQKLTSGNSHVYKMTPNGGVNHTVDMRSWTNGWTISVPFAQGSKNYLFLLKRSNGRMHVNEINNDGSIGPLIDNRDWSSGWTSAAIYKVASFFGEKTYLFLLKSGNGRMRVREINPDGTIGPSMQTSVWSKGWTSSVPFTVGAKNYLFLLKRGSGRMHVNEINGDGTIGPIIDNHDWASGWTSAATYKAPTLFGEKNYLFLLKAGDGRMHINEINANGTIGPLIDNRDWSSGWTTAVTYAITGQNYLFLLKEGGAGRVHIHQLNADGTVGIKVDEREWSSGWTTVAFYSTSLGTYISLIKA